MNKSTLTAGLALGLTALAGWQLARDDADSQMPPQIQRLEDANAATQPIGLPASPVVRDASPAPSPGSEPYVVPDTAAESQRHVPRHAQRGPRNTTKLAMDFGVQERDPGWADLMEIEIVRRLSQSTALAVTSMDVACRETICRVRLFFPIGGRARPAQLDSLLETDGLDPRIGFTFGEEGGVPMTTAYLERNDLRRNVRAR